MTNTQVKTAGDMINIKNIKDNVIYCENGDIIAFLKLKGISTDLLSDSEKRRKIKYLTADLSRIDTEFSLLAISRPFNIEPLLNEFNENMRNANEIQRKILRMSMNQITNFVEDGEAMERMMYIKVFDKTLDEVRKKQELIKEAFDNSQVNAEYVKDSELARLINLFNNPKTYNYDHIDNNMSIPILDTSKLKGEDSENEEK